MQCCFLPQKVALRRQQAQEEAEAKEMGIEILRYNATPTEATAETGMEDNSKDLSKYL